MGSPATFVDRDGKEYPAEVLGVHSQDEYTHRQQNPADLTWSAGVDLKGGVKRASLHVRLAPLVATGTSEEKFVELDGIYHESSKPSEAKQFYRDGYPAGWDAVMAENKRLADLRAKQG
jgi:hypothetical protein